jgi:hypothetical protein
VIVLGAVTMFTAVESTKAAAQPISALFTHVQTLTLDDGTPVSGPVSIAGDTAVVGAEGLVHVFERESGGDDWVHSATLVASDGGSFRQSVATDGNTIVSGAPRTWPDAGTATVFQRVPGTQSWQETARLEGNENPGFFGHSVAVSGPTVVVGAPVASIPHEPRRPGVVYVFARDLGGPNAWGEAARLADPRPHPPTSLFHEGAFGADVAIDRDTVLVLALTPPPGGSPGPSFVVADVFSRHAQGPDAWELVATLSSGVSFGDELPSAGVSLSGDTAIVGGGRQDIGRSGATRIFQRDRGGPNGWGQVTEVRYPFETFVHGDWSIGGNLAVAGASTPSDVGVTVHARHQGGQDAWGEVERIHVPSSVSSSIAAVLSGDTVLLDGASPNTPIDVYVVDTDRDGVRDGIDACPRDPLNNVAGHCQRASAVHPVIDELIAQGEVTSERQGRRQIITATFTNTSDTAVQNPFFEVTELTGRNVLLNGDAGRGRIGATLSPDVGDGILSPGESMTVTFRIRLRTPNPYQFFVAFHGDPVPE